MERSAERWMRGPSWTWGPIRRLGLIRNVDPTLSWFMQTCPLRVQEQYCRTSHLERLPTAYMELSGERRAFSPVLAPQTTAQDQAQVAPDTQPKRIQQSAVQCPAVNPAGRPRIAPSRGVCKNAYDVSRDSRTSCCRHGRRAGRRGRGGRGWIYLSDDLSSSRSRQRGRLVTRLPVFVPLVRPYTQRLTSTTAESSRKRKQLTGSEIVCDAKSPRASVGT